MNLYATKDLNVKAFNCIQSKIADVYVNISKLSMTKVAEDLRCCVISQKFNISVKKICSMQLHALLYCNRMVYFLRSILLYY